MVRHSSHLGMQPSQILGSLCLQTAAFYFWHRSARKTAIDICHAFCIAAVHTGTLTAPTFSQCTLFPAWTLLAVPSRLPIWGCLSKCRATHSPRNMVIPGLLVSCSAEVATRFPRAGRRSVFLLAAPPARPAAIRPPAVRCHVSKTQAAVTVPSCP